MQMCACPIKTYCVNGLRCNEPSFDSKGFAWVISLEEDLQGISLGIILKDLSVSYAINC